MNGNETAYPCHTPMRRLSQYNGLTKFELFTAMFMQGVFSHKGECTGDDIEYCMETAEQLISKLDESEDEE